MAQIQLPLKIEQSTREDGLIQLNITVPASMYTQAYQGALVTLASQNKIDISEAIQEGEEALYQKVVGTVGEPQFLGFLSHYTMNALAPFAVSQQKLDIILDPEVSSSEQVTAGKDFHFTAVITPKPVYELSSYDPVTVMIPEITVSDPEIDAQLLQIAEANAKMIEDEGGEVLGNSEVEIAIESKDEKGPILNMTAENRVYKLGDGYLPKEFDDKLLGMKVDDTKTFEFDLPDFTPEVADGATPPIVPVTSTVTIKKVFKRVIPAINDAWVIENVPEARDTAGLRELVRLEGIDHKNRELEEYKYFAVASELSKRFQGSIPDEIYEHVRDELMANVHAQIQQSGETLDEFVKNQGMDQQQFSLQIMLQAREALRQGFSLDALARHMKLKLTDKDIEETLERMAPGKPEDARYHFESTGRIFQLNEAALRTKANNWLYETATFESTF